MANNKAHVLLDEEKKKIKEILEIDNEKLEKLETDERNLKFALIIVEEYDFEKALGRKLDKEEKKALMEVLIGQTRLNKGENKFISVLYEKLRKNGLEKIEAYGAIIRYASGENEGYALALQSKNIDINKNSVQKVTEETISKIIKKAQKKGKKLTRKVVGEKDFVSNKAVENEFNFVIEHVTHTNEKVKEDIEER